MLENLKMRQTTVGFWNARKPKNAPDYGGVLGD
jgi:hypothetical protein